VAVRVDEAGHQQLPLCVHDDSAGLVHMLPDLYSKIGDAIVPFGGVNPHGPMRHGTAEEVRTETRQVLKAASGRRLLLSTGTGTTPETTLENVRAMIETAVHG